ESHAKADPLRALRGRREKRQGIRGDRKLLKKMMVDHGVDVESHLIGMFNLPENLPSHLGIGFSRGRLHLGIDTESHRLPAPTVSHSDQTRHSRTEFWEGNGSLHRKFAQGRASETTVPIELSALRASGRSVR